MNGSGAQRVVPIVLVLIIIAVVIAAVVSVARNIFGSSDAETTVDTSQEALVDTSVGRSVRLTVRGPIVGDDKFNSYTITVSSTSRNLTTYQGYLENQLDTEQLGNNSKGYTEFVHALERANLVEGDELTGDANDTRGICATGRLYMYEVLNGGTAVKTLWTTSCSNAKGSLKATNAVVMRLFQQQIPDTTSRISSLRL